MNLIDKVILEWSYRTKKGYPDINNKNDLKVFESLFGFNFLSENAFEREVRQKILDIASGDLEKMGDDYRVANKGKIDAAKFIEYIKTAYPEAEVKIVPPKQSPNRSRSFNAFIFKVDGREVNLNLAGGATANKGVAFEEQVVNDLNNYKKEVNEFTHQKLVEAIIKEFNLSPDNFRVEAVGGKNQKRSLIFTDEGPRVSTPEGQSVAETLADLQIFKEGETKPYNLSLKYNETLTFFNAGTKSRNQDLTIFPEDEIIDGKITNPRGVALLEMLGIDNELFCRVFNEYKEDQSGTNFKEFHREETPDQNKLNQLMLSGIGSGYYMVKGSDRGSFDFFLIDDEYLKKAAEPTSKVFVEYGGSGGFAKRVNVKFTTGKYKISINIRNKQGGIAPTHIMADYKPI
jgi:hypothetical protein